MKIKAFFAKNKIVIAALLGVAIVGAGAATTTAFLMDSTEPIVNTFTPGAVETTIEEDLAEGTLKKEPTVKNVGTVPCYIRMRAIVSPLNKDESLVDYVDELDLDNWNYNSDDGFYYYQKEVSVNGSTTPLFKRVNEDKANALANGEKFEILLYQEAVQAEVTNEKLNGGNATTDMMDIWDFYDTYGTIN